MNYTVIIKAHIKGKPLIKKYETELEALQTVNYALKQGFIAEYRQSQKIESKTYSTPKDSPCTVVVDYRRYSFIAKKIDQWVTKTVEEEFLREDLPSMRLGERFLQSIARRGYRGRLIPRKG
jgi:hypothetical protein